MMAPAEHRETGGSAAGASFRGGALITGWGAGADHAIILSRNTALFPLGNDPCGATCPGPGLAANHNAKGS